MTRLQLREQGEENCSWLLNCNLYSGEDILKNQIYDFLARFATSQNSQYDLTKHFLEFATKYSPSCSKAYQTIPIESGPEILYQVSNIDKNLNNISSKVTSLIKENHPSEGYVLRFFKVNLHYYINMFFDYRTIQENLDKLLLIGTPDSFDLKQCFQENKINGECLFSMILLKVIFNQSYHLVLFKSESDLNFMKVLLSSMPDSNFYSVIDQQMMNKLHNVDLDYLEKQINDMVSKIEFLEKIE